MCIPALIKAAGQVDPATAAAAAAADPKPCCITAAGISCETFQDCFNFRQVQRLAAKNETLHMEVTLTEGMTRPETRISLTSAPKTSKNFGNYKLLPPQECISRCHHGIGNLDHKLVFTPLRVGWPPTPHVFSVRDRG